ncbi:MAG: acyl-CoA dehydrogenase family protein [Acidimicrobiia bacterium]
MSYPRQPSRFLDDDLDAFRRSIASFVDNEIRPHADEWEAAGEFPLELYRKAAAAGIIGLRYDPKWGGGGGSYLATCVLGEELVKGDTVGTPVGLMAQSEFALSVLADEGSDELKVEYLEPAIKGELIGAIGVTEPGAGSDVGAIATKAVRDGDHYVISGQKTFITNGTRADFITLAVRTGGAGPSGVSVVMFPTNTPGFTMGRKLEKLGSRASDTAELFFDECRVPARNLVGEEGQGMRYILSHFAGERLVIAAFAVGIMERLIEIGIDYASSREVFGKPLASLQTWRHRFVDMSTRLEATRLLSYQAADLLDQGDPTGEMAVSAAKLYAAEAVQFVAAEILQLHGGFGQMEESSVPRYFRDVAGFSIGAGTSEIQREIISKALIR